MTAWLDLPERTVDELREAYRTLLEESRGLADRRRAEIWQAAIRFAAMQPGAGFECCMVKFGPREAVEQAIALHAEFEKQLSAEGGKE